MTSDHTHKHDEPGHSHALTATSDNRRRLTWAFVLTALFMVAEVIGGLVSGSLALLADAGHMLTDAAALALALFALAISKRPPDSKRTFGYLRIQVLAAFVNALSLVAIVIWIVIEAVNRLMDPPDVVPQIMLGVAIGGLIVNLVVFRIVHRTGEENLNMRGAALHVLGDLLGSVAAIVAALVIWLTGWSAADPILSLLVALLIIRSAWALLKNSSHILLEGSPLAIDRETLRRELMQRFPEIEDAHHIHVWSLAAENKVLSMHVAISATSDQPALLRRIKRYLHAEFHIEHSTIEIDLGACADDTSC